MIKSRDKGLGKKEVLFGLFKKKNLCSLKIIFCFMLFTGWPFLFHPSCQTAMAAAPSVSPEGEYIFFMPDELLCFPLEASTFKRPDIRQNSPLKFCAKNSLMEEASGIDDWPEHEEFDEESDWEMDLICDPIEPVNRAFFSFNDKLYFWVLKPVSTGYNKVVPEPLRENVHNFFYNLRMPIRGINCLLQGKIKGFGTEIGRFLINTTLGVLGTADPAKSLFDIESRDEDFGQTLGFFGLGPVIYINWPILGPSSLRDSIGHAGDIYLDPLHYIVVQKKYNFSARGYNTVNNTSLKIGEYESLKKAALDPYVSLRNAYYQYRKNMIRK